MQTSELLMNRRVVLQTQHGFIGTITGFRPGEFRVSYDGDARPIRAPRGTPHIRGGRFWYPLSSAHMFVDIAFAVAEVISNIQVPEGE